MQKNGMCSSSVTFHFNSLPDFFFSWICCDCSPCHSTLIYLYLGLSVDYKHYHIMSYTSPFEDNCFPLAWLLILANVAYRATHHRLEWQRDDNQAPRIARITAYHTHVLAIFSILLTRAIASLKVFDDRVTLCVYKMIDEPSPGRLVNLFDPRCPR